MGQETKRIQGESEEEKRRRSREHRALCQGLWKGAGRRAEGELGVWLQPSLDVRLVGGLVPGELCRDLGFGVTLDLPKSLFLYL